MTKAFADKVVIELTVNGEPVEARVPAGQHVVDFLRQDLGLTGAHSSCEHGVCGACTIRVDGSSVRGCLMLAAQLDGSDVWTIEGLSDKEAIRDLQEPQSVSICQATTAAVPDMRQLSMPSKRWRSNERDRCRYDRSVWQSRPAQFLHWQDGSTSQRRPIGRGSG